MRVSAKGADRFSSTASKGFSQASVSFRIPNAQAREDGDRRDETGDVASVFPCHLEHATSQETELRGRCEREQQPPARQQTVEPQWTGMGGSSVDVNHLGRPGIVLPAIRLDDFNLRQVGQVSACLHGKLAVNFNGNNLPTRPD
jgi:hypothetical protein